ncbi:indolepyruvate decarboxylase, partial [Mycobacterium tuberculosis]
AVPALAALLAAAVVPPAPLLWGPRLLAARSPPFLGLSAGAARAARVRAALAGAPVLVTAGVVFPALVSGFFSQR